MVEYNGKNALRFFAIGDAGADYEHLFCAKSSKSIFRVRGGIYSSSAVELLKRHMTSVVDATHVAHEHALFVGLGKSVQPIRCWLLSRRAAWLSRSMED